MLKNRKIILGITGGIAAYKAAELTRQLVKGGAEVKVVMTRHAREFITPLTMQTLSGGPVFLDMFDTIKDYEIAHIALADYADLLVIVPATANVIGKIASGIADDLLTTTVMATRSPVLICPAMNVNMYENAIVQEQVRKLAGYGYHVLEPAAGELACGTSGKGRLPEIPKILEEIESLLTVKDMVDEHVLVTAGPTREPFDPVRFITNYSSGKMGYAVATMARRRGATVTLVSGPVQLPIPAGVFHVSVSSAREMRDAVMAALPEATVVIKAAAVADYRPAVRQDQKIKKKNEDLTVKLERNPDIIHEIGAKKEDRILVGFAMESEHLVEHAIGKMVAKNMDFIVANDVTKEGAGFQGDTNIITILDRDGEMQELPLMDKMEAAGVILDKVREIRERRRSQPEQKTESLLSLWKTAGGKNRLQ
ncbi:MAG: Coenzyme A biosynthesis bifunctional protein CoaBC [Syntrophus sp. PtaU1.Bin005]|jgi:phosphopantothenoylcysteine decarboxylase/phosphopantothenate--cysteine ligase|uniref:bifunctional phosphopantothenoylcysteine decarboxylase/phosphopantothenate--cysteine ligase CoaBC n=1 Tax=Syntrophus TaxID=43773 RepID=UPI0009CE9421|nr:MAG: Coenzyme A biosynthesis bifunctional protein CoaBC [Syntrophus sp. PtaB.Bin138]OPY83484.1 MAG: Coenzyme A biosynthesis bifunctional protein CoaBC [Syntrophus sp. PtaU1.Bin005]